MSGLRQVVSCPGPAHPAFGKRPQTRKIHFGLGFLHFHGIFKYLQMLAKHQHIYEVWACYSGVAEDSRLLGCATMPLDEWFLVFRRLIGPSEHLQLLPQWHSIIFQKTGIFIRIHMHRMRFELLIPPTTNGHLIPWRLLSQYLHSWLNKCLFCQYAIFTGCPF